MVSEDLYSELMDLMGYMITSARGLLDEPQIYGPFRLVEGVSRLCGLMEKEEGADSAFLSQLKAKIDEGKFSVMSDVDAFTKMLDEIVLEEVLSREILVIGSSDNTLKIKGIETPEGVISEILPERSGDVQIIPLRFTSYSLY